MIKEIAKILSVSEKKLKEEAIKVYTENFNFSMISKLKRFE
jgi:hypothetical protein